MDWVKAGLATWAIAWALSLWHKTDFFRARFGVYPVLAKDGFQVDREDGGGIGSWLNCPLCAVILAFPLGWVFRKALAPLGLALLLMRWWEGARVKAEWWT